MHARLAARLVVGALALAAGVSLASGATAQPPPEPTPPLPEATPAQPPEAPEPEPQPPAPPAAPPVQPAPAPAAPPPSVAPVAPVRADPAPTAPAPPRPEDAFRGGAPHLYLGTRNLLRTSHFDWTTGLSLELLGGDDGLHTMDFALVPRLSFLQTDDHWAFVGTRVSVAVVLAEDRSSDVDSPAFADLPIDLGYAYTFLQRGDGLVVRAGPRGTVAFPTSPASNGIGVYLTTRLGLQIDGNIPLLPGEALNGVFITGSAGWQHRFTEAQIPVGEDVVRQSASGNQFTSDVISARYLERDRFTLSLAWWLNLWGDLSLGNGWGIGFPVKYAAEEPVCIAILNAPCAEVRPDEQVTSLAYGTSFDVSLSYLAARLVWIGVGYANSAPSLDAAGKRRSVFYSPAAQVYLSATLLLDRIPARAKR